MTDTTTTTSTSKSGGKKPAGNLTGMLLPELKTLAGQLGIAGASGMRKADLAAAISAQQSNGSTRSSSAGPKSGASSSVENKATRTPRADRDASTPAIDTTSSPDTTDRAPAENGEARTDRPRNRDRYERNDRNRNDRGDGQGQGQGQGQRGDRNRNDRGDGQQGQGQGQRNDRNRTDRNDRGDRPEGNNQGNRYDEDGGRNNNRRRRRGRDRDRPVNRPMGRDRYDNEPEITDDDVLLPVAGILDILDNYGFVRTTGYLPGPNDVYVSLSMVKKFGLRKGDAITGTVRAVAEGNDRQKFTTGCGNGNTAAVWRCTGRTCN